MSGGFYKRRRGILEHLEAGTISLLDLAVHDFLNLKANLRIGGRSSLPAGVCLTSAAAIHAMCPAQISEKAVQRSLAHLEKIGWIRRWNVPGKRGNYPVLICRASVHDASGNECRVSGDETTDWRNPVYAPVSESYVKRPRTVQLLSSDREERGEKEKKTKLAPEIAAVVPMPALAEWIPEDAWAAYLKLRKEKRAKVTPEAVDLLIRKLDAWRHVGQDVREILERSVMNGWTGIFPLPKEGTNGSVPNRKRTIGEGFSRTLRAAQRVWGDDPRLDSEICSELPTGA